MGYGGGHHNYYGSQANASYKTSDRTCCVGGKRLSRWNVEGGVGTDFVVGGDAITGSQAHPGFTGPATTLRDVKMSDAYDTGYRAELGGSYALNPNRKVTLQGHYAHANGKQVEWGTQGTNTLRGTLSDYDSYGVEAGIRQYAYPARVPLLKSVRPYVEGKVGAAHVNHISLNNINEVGGLANPNTPTTVAMYEGGWVPTGAALIGIETPVFNRFTMGVETGIRYAGKPNSDGTDIGQTGTFPARYGGMNNGGDRWSVPLTIRGRYRF